MPPCLRIYPGGDDPTDPEAAHKHKAPSKLRLPSPGHAMVQNDLEKLPPGRKEALKTERRAIKNYRSAYHAPEGVN